MGLGNSRPNP